MKSSLCKNKLLWASLVLMDLIAIGGAFLLAYWIRIHSGIIPFYSEVAIEGYLCLYVYSIPVIFLIFHGTHLYDCHDLFCGTSEYIQVVKGCTFCILAVIVLSFIVHALPPSRGWLLGVWILGIGFVCGGRFIFRLILRRMYGNGSALEKVLIIGANEEAKALAERIERAGMVHVVGFLDEFSPQGEEICNGKVVLGPPYYYREFCQREGVDLVILVPDAISWETQREVLRQAVTYKDIEVNISPGFNEIYTAAMRVSFKGNTALLRFRPGYVTGLDALLKECMDYTLALFLLILTAPAIVTLALILSFQGVRPVIEGFDVLGKNGRPFRIYRFRTGVHMPTSYRSFRRNGNLVVRKHMITSIGHFLFQTGMDKLPQLLNVLMGQMSLVGPRIVPLESSSKYGPWLAGILVVKPGMIGTWALRKARNLEEEISLTFHYVRDWSFGKDLAIFGQTLLEIFRTRFRTRIVHNKKGWEKDWQSHSIMSTHQKF
jgi:lipopolysaccharide/colanic/teichoic acid biosynthesis glycosyltransferase